MMNTTGDISSGDPPSRNFLIVLVVMDSLFVVCGVVGNLVVIMYNLCINPTKNATSYFIINLAISDLLVCGIYFPTYITEAVRILLGTAKGEDLICQISFTVTSLSLSLSVVNIMMLTIDRYIYITLPLKYPTIVTTRRTCIALAVVWAAGVTNGAFVFVGTKSTGVPLICEADIRVGLPATAIFFYIPLTATVLFNLKILKIARAHRRKIAAQAPSELSTTTGSISPRRHLARQFQLFKTFTVVFGCFLLCVTPFPVIVVIDVLACGGGCIPIEVICLAAILAGANSVLNAFIYGLRHEEYRRAFRALVYRPCSRD